MDEKQEIIISAFMIPAVELNKGPTCWYQVDMTNKIWEMARAEVKKEKEKKVYEKLDLAEV